MAEVWTEYKMKNLKRARDREKKTSKTNAILANDKLWSMFGITIKCG